LGFDFIISNLSKSYYSKTVILHWGDVIVKKWLERKIWKVKCTGKTCILRFNYLRNEFNKI